MDQRSPTIEKPPHRVGFAHLPLYARVLIGVALGLAFGIIFKTGPILAGLRNEDLGQLGMLVIRLLKALAVPLILFAILDAFLRVEVSARRVAHPDLPAQCLGGVRYRTDAAQHAAAG